MMNMSGVFLFFGISFASLTGIKTLAGSKAQRSAPMRITPYFSAQRISSAL